jgi:hypothetical protein
MDRSDNSKSELRQLMLMPLKLNSSHVVWCGAVAEDELATSAVPVQLLHQGQEGQGEMRLDVNSIHLQAEPRAT